jgi:hypothetical protein
MFNNRFNQIRPRPNLPTPAPVSPAVNTLDASIESIIAAMGANSQAVNNLVNALSKSYEHQYSFSKYIPIDLTSAHTDMKITTVKPLDFIQIWSDGPLDGISIKVGTQNQEPISLSQMPVVPVVDNPETIYFTNDVRQGRNQAIIYFVRGGFPLTLSYGGQDISLAELAARNNSINVFDRRGTVMWQDSFEDGLQKWITSTSGLATIVCSTDLSRSGSVSGRMYNPDTENCQLVKSVPFASQSPFGFEASFARDLPGGTTNIKILFELDVYDGANYIVGKLTYNEATTSLYYMDTAGNDILLSNTVDISSGVFDFSTVKLVIDSVKKQYVRCVLNGYVFDLRNIPLFEAVAAGSPFLESIISLETADGASDSVAYIDDVIITKDEP